MVHQLIERLLGLRVDEPVIAQLPDPARDVGRERVQERLAHPGVVLGAERERRSLAVDDVVEPFAQLLERPGQVQVRLLAGAPLAEARTQGVEPVEAPPASRAAAAATAHPPRRAPRARRRRSPRATRRPRARGRRGLACRPSASSGPAPDQPTSSSAERRPSADAEPRRERAQRQAEADERRQGERYPRPGSERFLAGEEVGDREEHEGARTRRRSAAKWSAFDRKSRG